jgi:hypothetical protein
MAFQQQGKPCSGEVVGLEKSLRGKPEEGRKD